MRPLRRNRLLLIASLALLGATLGLTFTLLRPDGLVRARTDAWGPRGLLRVDGVEGYPSDRFGAPCGVREWVDGQLREVPLPECTSYVAPAVLVVGQRVLAVWEYADHEIAIGALDRDLQVEELITLVRPRTAAGTLLPRVDVRSDGEELAIWYHDGRVVTVDGALGTWPGGAQQVAAARLGPRGSVMGLGILALLLFYLLAAGWTLSLPDRLRRRFREGRTLEVTLPARGSTAVVGGQAVELELRSATFFGATWGQLAGATATLVLRRSLARGDAYRTRDAVEVEQVWPGPFHEAWMRARAMRAGAVAAAIGALAVLLLALDAYLVL